MAGYAVGLFQNLSKDAKRILDLIQKNGPITKKRLLAMSGMKLTTLNRVMKPLIVESIVSESGIAESTGGRKPVLYDINDGRYYLIGVDISRTYTKIVVTNLKMRILCQRQFSMLEGYSPQETVQAITSMVSCMMGELSITHDMILGVGVGTIGPIDRRRGIIIDPKNFTSPHWANVPIKEMMEKGLHLPVLVDNGANTAVLAEHLFGLGRGLDNIVYVNCGVGIRTGAISSGTIIRSINDAEDAFGHMVIDVDGEPCICGNYGCIECYSSIVSIKNRFVSEIKKGRPSIITKPLDKVEYTDICLAAQQQDILSREVILNAATIMGAGLANYINLLNPDLVILSGVLIKNSRLFYDICTEAARKRLYLKEGSKVAFSNGGYFKDGAIAVGAAAMLVEKALDKNIV